MIDNDEYAHNVLQVVCTIVAFGGQVTSPCAEQWRQQCSANQKQVFIVLSTLLKETITIQGILLHFHTFVKIYMHSL